MRLLLYGTLLVFLGGLSIVMAQVDVTYDAQAEARLLEDGRIISGLSPGALHTVRVTGSTNAPMQGLMFMYVEDGIGKVTSVAIGDSFCFRPIDGFYQLAPVYLDWVDSADNIGTLTVTITGSTPTQRNVDTRTDAIMVTRFVDGLSANQPTFISVSENPPISGVAVRHLFAMYLDDSGDHRFRAVLPGEGFSFSPAPVSPNLGVIFLDWATLLDNNGVFRVHTDLLTNVEPVGLFFPTAFALFQNYPNPFNPTTTIQFSLPQATVASMVVYNTLGQEAAMLVNEHLAPGTYSTEWNAEGMPSGVYFYRLQAGNFVETKKLVLLR